jgi:thiol-disulfide isomerase/thioredoxin
MKKQAALTLLILTLLVLSAGYYTFDVVRKQPNVNKATESILENEEGKVTYVDVTGNEVNLTDNFGKIVIVTLWASWSPFSVEELPRLNSLASEFDRSRVSFVALNRKESRHQAERFLSTLPELPNLQIVIDQDDKYYNGVGGYAMPETIVYDQKGVVLLHIRGVSKNDDLKEAITKGLK